MDSSSKIIFFCNKSCPKSWSGFCLTKLKIWLSLMQRIEVHWPTSQGQMATHLSLEDQDCLTDWICSTLRAEDFLFYFLDLQERRWLNLQLQKLHKRICSIHMNIQRVRYKQWYHIQVTTGLRCFSSFRSFAPCLIHLYDLLPGIGGGCRESWKCSEFVHQAVNALCSLLN